MARYTIREFASAVGLKSDQDGLTRSGVVLKALCGLGVAREVGKKQGNTGRPAVVYEVQDPIVIPLGTPRGVTAEQVAEEVTPAPVQSPVSVPVAVSAPAPVSGNYSYDDDEED